jgi:ABC-type cobalamin/Fe3+-siderophores transport system ATPase subunit
MTLSGVNLTFKEGSFVCILGKAASGKTTLLQTINGETISVSDKDMEMLGGS